MSNNLEKEFLLELNKRKRKPKIKLIKKIFNFWRSFVINLKYARPKYIFGFTLLFLALIYQYNITFITNPINSLITKLIYQPVPPISASPWSWENNNQVHPLIVNISQENEATIKSVANYIAKNESNPYLRIKAIHDYIISRIDYDIDVLKTGIRPSQDPQTVFKTHKAVCEGYARLFHALSRAMGEEAVYIRGRIRQELAPDDLIPSYLKIGTSKYDWTLHAWNAVKVGDSWQLVDTTWDDNEQNKYSSDYLMLPPLAMIASHFPDLPSWQLLAEAKNYKSFEKSPIMQPQFFAQNLALISPQEYETDLDRVALIKLKVPSDYQKELVAFFTPIAKESLISWDLFQQKKNTLAKKDFSQCQTKYQETEIKITCNFSQSGKYEVFLFSRELNLTALGKLKFF
jgi:transglutaminase-like putative cysteine protease